MSSSEMNEDDTFKIGFLAMSIMLLKESKHLTNIRLCLHRSVLCQCFMFELIEHWGMRNGVWYFQMRSVVCLCLTQTRAHQQPSLVPGKVETHCVRSGIITMRRGESSIPKCYYLNTKTSLKQKHQIWLCSERGKRVTLPVCDLPFLPSSILSKIHEPKIIASLLFYSML